MMVDCIINNKEWLFSGVVAIVIGVITWIITRRRSRKPLKVSLNGEPLQVIIDAPPPPKQEPITTTTNLLPRDIINKVNSAPLLQQSDIRKQYEGLKVSWKGILQHAEKKEEENVKIMISVGKIHLDNMVFFNVNPNQYAGIGLLRRGHEMLVEGAISRVEERYIYLDLENLVFNVSNSE